MSSNGLRKLFEKHFPLFFAHNDSYEWFSPLNVMTIERIRLKKKKVQNSAPIHLDNGRSEQRAAV